MLFLFALIAGGMQSLCAQQVIVSASGNASGSGGSSTYTVGQVAFHTYGNTAGIVTEGVQQPYEILFMDGIVPRETLSLEIVLFPNPAVKEVTIRLSGKKPMGDLEYLLSDVRGTLLKSGPVSVPETVMPVDDLAPATYMLSIAQKGVLLQTYRIIKNQGK